MRMNWMAAVVAGTMLATVPTAAIAKKKDQPTGLALQQIQSKDFEADKGVAFSAVMTVLQDEGYRISAADKDTGLITGVGQSSKKLTWLPFVGFGTSKKSPAISAFIEELAPGMTRVRLNFVMAKIKANAYGTDLGDEEAIIEPSVYSDAFEKIAQGVFLRQSMAAKASANAAPAPVATPAPTAAVAPVPASPVTVTPGAI